jgi:hypothetical protein
MSEAGIDAVSLVAETNVVVRSVPFQRTIEPTTNPLPSTVSVNAGSPAAAVEGVSPVSEGAGFPVTVKTRAVVVPPPGAGVKTKTSAIPTVAMSEAGIAAVKRVAET